MLLLDLEEDLEYEDGGGSRTATGAQPKLAGSGGASPVTRDHGSTPGSSPEQHSLLLQAQVDAAAADGQGSGKQRSAPLAPTGFTPAEAYVDRQERTVFFAKCAPSASVDDVARVFQAFGEVEEINLFRQWPSAKASRGCGLAVMATSEGASAAIDALHRKFTWDGVSAAMVCERCCAARLGVKAATQHATRARRTAAASASRRGSKGGGGGGGSGGAGGGSGGAGGGSGGAGGGSGGAGGGGGAGASQHSGIMVAPHPGQKQGMLMTLSPTRRMVSASPSAMAMAGSIYASTLSAPLPMLGTGAAAPYAVHQQPGLVQQRQPLVSHSQQLPQIVQQQPQHQGQYAYYEDRANSAPLPMVPAPGGCDGGFATALYAGSPVDSSPLAGGMSLASPGTGVPNMCVAVQAAPTQRGMHLGVASGAGAVAVQQIQQVQHMQQVQQVQHMQQVHQVQQQQVQQVHHQHAQQQQVHQQHQQQQTGEVAQCHIALQTPEQVQLVCNHAATLSALSGAAFWLQPSTGAGGAGGLILSGMPGQLQAATELIGQLLGAAGTASTIPGPPGLVSQHWS